MSEPSQAESNKLLRVLKGTRGKFTCTIHLPDGRMFEFQSNNKPALEFLQEPRSLWLMSSAGYEDKTPIMEWVPGAVLLCEKNPE